MSQIRGPLDGVRVVDISSSYAAPTASMYLGDMGADVIKVEPTWGDDARGWGPPFLNGEAAWFLSVNRNKKSLCLDIRSERGLEVLFRLLDTADVFIQNLNPAKLERHGLGLATLLERFPQLVICALSGFGLDGPDSALPGYDLIAQARSGMMSVTGVDDVPQRVSTALSDVAAGTVAAFAVAAALVRQRTTGVGEIVDVSLLEADLAFMTPRIAAFLAGGEEPRPSGGTDSVIAVYQSFATADRTIVVALGNDRLWKRACLALGLNDMAEDAELATNAKRSGRRAEVVDAFTAALGDMTSEAALKALQSAGVPCSPINYLSEVVTDPQVVARDAIVEQKHPVAGSFRSVGPPWRLGSDDSRQPRIPPPLVGEHGREILTDVGFEPSVMEELVEEGVVWLP
jgi:crotonobetainyl-CoA:carnitine CoA-transferase CaiB-like acyl-CoA transferase